MNFTGWLNFSQLPVLNSMPLHLKILVSAAHPALSQSAANPHFCVMHIMRVCRFQSDVACMSVCTWAHSLALVSLLLCLHNGSNLFLLLPFQVFKKVNLQHSFMRCYRVTSLHVYIYFFFSFTHLLVHWTSFGGDFLSPFIIISRSNFWWSVKGFSFLFFMLFWSFPQEKSVLSTTSALCHSSSLGQGQIVVNSWQRWKSSSASFVVVIQNSAMLPLLSFNSYARRICDVKVQWLTV